MRVSTVLLGAVLLAPVVVLGGSSTAQDKGMKHAVKEHARDTTDALHITPKVKSAIIADPQLNNRRNRINVGTRDYVVHLKGHVYSQALRDRATRVAAHKLSVMHKNYKVSNELSISR